MRSKAFLIVLVSSLLPFLFFFHTSDLPHTHDGLVHIPRIAAYFKALSEGAFPVRWAGDLNYGYGLPLFNFMYPLPYLVASFFVFLGLGLVVSFKLTLCLSFFLSGIFMYLFSNLFFKDEKKALVVTMLYQFASFRFIELFLRGSLGEVYTYTFLPLVLYGLVRISKKATSKNIILTGIAAALLILSHNSVSLVFYGVCVLFVFFFLSSIKKKIVGFLSLFLGMILSSFYWIPAILEHKYTYGDLFMESLYKSHFANIWYFFIPNILNSPQFQIEHISIQIGLFQVGALLLGIYFLFRKKDQLTKKVVIFSLVIFLGALFLMQPVSIFLWEKISFLRQFQFPWRFLSVVVFASSFCGVSYCLIPKFTSSKYFYIFIFLIVLSSFSYFLPQLGYKKINENYYWNFPLNTTYYGETDVIWSAGPAKKYPKSPVEVASGSAQIKNYTKKSTQHTFDVVSKGNTQLALHVEYFPGWRVMVNNIDTPIQFQDPNYRGEITFPVPEGDSHVAVSFTENKLRFLADMISIFGIGIVMILFVLRKKIVV